MTFLVRYKAVELAVCIFHHENMDRHYRVVKGNLRHARTACLHLEMVEPVIAVNNQISVVVALTGAYVSNCLFGREGESFCRKHFRKTAGLLFVKTVCFNIYNADSVAAESHDYLRIFKFESQRHRLHHRINRRH